MGSGLCGMIKLDKKFFLFNNNADRKSGFFNQYEEMNEVQLVVFDTKMFGIDWKLWVKIKIREDTYWRGGLCLINQYYIHL